MLTRLIVATAWAIFVWPSVPALAQGTQRGVRAATRTALTGCWVLGDDEIYIIEAHGPTGLRARWRARSRRGVDESHHEEMLFHQASQLVIAGCGARTQHGQFCRFSAAGSGAPEVTRVSRYSGRATRLAVRACGESETLAPPSPRPPRAIPADASVARLLGSRQRDIDAARTPTGTQDGWTQYGDDLAIRYEAGLAMAVRMRLTPSPASCQDAARAAGYEPPEGSAPLRRADGCVWPGVSRRHTLAPRVSASFIDGVFEAVRISG